MIIYPKTFNEMTPAGFDGVFDWDFLKPAFDGTNIMPMDIDAVVERYGRVLLFETKKPGKNIPLGQKITLKTILKLGKGNIHLIILYGKTPSDMSGMEEWGFARGKIRIKKKVDCNTDYILKRVSAWFRWANHLENAKEN